METLQETKNIIGALKMRGIGADYLFPSYNENEEETRFIILVHDFNFDKACAMFPSANIQISN